MSADNEGEGSEPAAEDTDEVMITGEKVASDPSTATTVGEFLEAFASKPQHLVHPNEEHYSSAIANRAKPAIKTMNVREWEFRTSKDSAKETKQQAQVADFNKVRINMQAAVSLCELQPVSFS